MTDPRIALADRLVITKPSWLPISGHVKNITFTLDECEIVEAALRAIQLGELEQDDPSADPKWNAGLDFGMEQFCKVLGVDPKKVNWDAATEELEGDVQSVIGNILRAKYGEDFDPKSACPCMEGLRDVSPAPQNPLIDTEQSGHGLSLLPCPFCGHKKPRLVMTEDDGVALLCRSIACGVEVHADDEQTLLSRWNTRK